MNPADSEGAPVVYDVMIDINCGIDLDALAQALEYLDGLVTDT